MKGPYEILLKPILTEKSTALSEVETGCPQYTFQVARKANKVEIRKAIEHEFKVKVKKVSTMNLLGKKKRLRTQVGRRPNWKKAIVVLEEGQQINLY